MWKRGYAPFGRGRAPLPHSHIHTTVFSNNPVLHRAILLRVMETLFYFRAPSPVGPLFLAASTKGLVRLEFEARVQKLNPDATQLRESKPALTPYLR